MGMCGERLRYVRSNQTGDIAVDALALRPGSFCDLFLAALGDQQSDAVVGFGVISVLGGG